MTANHIVSQSVMTLAEAGVVTKATMERKHTAVRLVHAFPSNNSVRAVLVRRAA